jgi:prepilin-type N-terminal cleavage/methylation domain-containing protein
MRPTISNTKRGFSLIELMVAMAIGLIILGAATQLFKTAMDSTSLVTEQAEMQQNVRSALNLIARDVSMAGAGLPPGGLALPYGAGTVSSRFGCDLTAKCYLVSYKYPNGPVGGAPVPNFMYGLIPGPINGLEVGGPALIPATNATADSVTSIYVDYSFPLNAYDITFPDLTGTKVTAIPPAAPAPPPPPIMGPGGITKNDLILLSNTANGGASAIGEVTNLIQQGANTEIDFADGDPLKINQSAAPNGNIAYIATTDPAVPTVAYRVWAVTYFIEIPGNGQTPRLMRQVNGHPPIPVADNIIGLNVTYDTCTGVAAGPCAGLRDPINNVPSYSPNQINKVNIQVMGQSVLSPNGKSVSMALATSVTARNIAYKARY